MVPRVALGRTGMSISRVGLGTWAMGGPNPRMSWGPQDDQVSVRTIRHAVECGINWLDTAPIYGLGHAEEVVGVALRGMPESARPYVFTKCGLRWDARAQVTRRGAETSLRHELEQSLRRLGVDRVDLLQMHWPAEDGTPIEEYWDTLLRLRDEGKARAVGLSNHDVAGLVRAAAAEVPATLQPPLSALRREALAELIPWCRSHGTGVITHSTMHHGLLSGAFDADRVNRLVADDWRRGDSAFNADHLPGSLAVTAALAKAGQDLGISTAAAAVAWVLAIPGVNGAIVGARGPSQVDDWLAAGMGHGLPADQMARVADAISTERAGSGPVPR